MLRRLLAAVAVVVAILLAVAPGSVTGSTAPRVYLPLVFGPPPTAVVPLPPSATPTISPTATPTAIPTATATIAPTATPTPAPANVLLNPGFEQGFADWTTGGSPLLSPFAHTGSYSVLLGGYNNAADGVAQTFVIPGCARSAFLQYWYYPVAVPNAWNYVDELTMDLRDMDAYPWPVIATIPNYMPLPPVSGPWQVGQSTTGDLTPYRGHVAAVEIDATTGPTSLSKWYIDDVQVTFTC